jgi:hypothetical protein
MDDKGIWRNFRTDGITARHFRGITGRKRKDRTVGAARYRLNDITGRRIGMQRELVWITRKQRIRA